MEMDIEHKRDSEIKLIKAVSTIIEDEGFARLGINRIARTAGCDKVLIYRYFGGLEGLLTAWAKENDFYTSAYERFYEEIQTTDQSRLRELTKKVILEQLHFLRDNAVMQELILWELTGHSKFVILQDIREKNGHKLQQLFNDVVRVKSEDAGLYITVLITSIEFIILYTRQYRFFNGVDFTEPDAWSRFEKVIANYIDMLFNTLI